LLNLRRILATAGATTRDLVKLNLHIVNYDPEKRLHARPLQKRLNSHRPAITVIPVPALAVAGWLFEIDAVVALPDSPPRLFQNPRGMEDVDVVVIGAGLSGLTTAEAVIKTGYSCITLEARDRVGGSTWSQTLGQGDGSGIVDLQLEPE
jgi:monoamine oxidase